MGKRVFSFFIIFIFLIIPVKTIPQSTESDAYFLTLEQAQRIADAAEDRVRRDNWNVVIAIVDAGGHLVTLRRSDGVQTASIDIAIQKARTAAFYKRSTKIFQDRLSAGENAILSLPDMMPFEGGLPIVKNGIIIGAIGVSGVTAEQDGIIAQAGLDVFQ
jgi:glc operon protein GlcG